MVILKLSIREAEYRSVLVWPKSCWRRPRTSSTISTMTWNVAMIPNFLGDEVKCHNISELNMNRGNTDWNLLLLKCQQKKSLACGFGSRPLREGLCGRLASAGKRNGSSASRWRREGEHMFTFLGRMHKASRKKGHFAELGLFATCISVLKDPGVAKVHSRNRMVRSWT